MIVRLMGEGQYEVDDDAPGELNELDDQAERRSRPATRSALDGAARRRWPRLVERTGERLPDDDLSPSDAIVPPERPDARGDARAVRGRGPDPGPAQPLTGETTV